METEVKIIATIIIAAVDQNGNTVDVEVGKLVINEFVFDKIIVNEPVTDTE